MQFQYLGRVPVLPNGWVGTLANERYLSADGSVYEAVGVPADIEVRMTTEDIAAGRDLILESALQLASAE